MGLLWTTNTSKDATLLAHPDLKARQARRARVEQQEARSSRRAAQRSADRARKSYKWAEKTERQMRAQRNN